MLAEVVARQQRFPQAGGAATVQVLADVGKGLPTRESLEREDDLAAGRVRGFPEDGGVALQRGDGNDEGSHPRTMNGIRRTSNIER